MSKDIGGKNKTKATKTRVPLTRCSGTMTESAFWSWIRSHLRRLTVRWKPKYEALHEGRRPNQSSNKRLKWEVNCEMCGNWFPEKEIEMDHIIPCGQLRSFDDCSSFLERLLVERDGFRRLCKPCHYSLRKKE